jgi:hypothetical protein
MVVVGLVVHRNLLALGAHRTLYTVSSGYRSLRHVVFHLLPLSCPAPAGGAPRAQHLRRTAYVTPGSLRAWGWVTWMRPRTRRLRQRLCDSTGAVKVARTRTTLRVCASSNQSSAAQSKVTKREVLSLAAAAAVAANLTLADRCESTLRVRLWVRVVDPPRCVHGSGREVWALAWRELWDMGEEIPHLGALQTTQCIVQR